MARCGPHEFRVGEWTLPMQRFAALLDRAQSASRIAFNAAGALGGRVRREKDMAKPLRVGLLGLGTVGQGVARILLENAEGLAGRAGFELQLKQAADLDLDREFDVTIDRDILTTDAFEVCSKDDIDVIVEAIGGTTIARELVLAAIGAGKSVVTANKALLAEHGQEIFRAALDAGVSVNYEASTGGGIPLLSSVRDGLIANEIAEFYGILNGTANYVLTRMRQDDMPFDEAVRLAQQFGYAEADPTFDIEGIDSAHKAALLAQLAFHVPIGFDQVHVEGISRLRITDIRYAEELGYVIKLLCIGKRVRREAGKGIELRVHPTLLSTQHPLAAVRDNFNAVYAVGDAVGPVMFYGQGAGRMPTASAIVADLVDIGRGNAGHTFQSLAFFRSDPDDLPVVPMDDVRTRYFLRVTCADRSGVLASIAGHLGDNDISVAAVHQKEFGTATVPLVILTHEATERQFRAAINAIDGEALVTEPCTYIRVEGDGLA
jgi:homoserine dehydrogenase